MTPHALLPSRLALALGLALAMPAAAQVSIAGYVFDANAGPDATTPLPGSQPGFAAPSSACAAVSLLPGLTLEQSVDAVLLDTDLDEWLFNVSILQLDFTDNVVVNGPGADLVVFEIGGAESFALAVFNDAICEYSSAITYSVAPTGFTTNPCGTLSNAVNVRAIDLSDFGVLPASTVRRLRLDGLGQPTGNVGADIALVMALHSAPPTPAAPPCLLGFQQGLDGYAGAVDTAIAADFPGTNYASSAKQWVDGTPEHNLLLRFDGLVGGAAGQLPPGASVAKATLTLSSGTVSSDGSAGTHTLHRLLQPWNVATLTFASGFGGNGIDANGVEASVEPLDSVGPTGTGVTQELDVTAAVQAWADGAPNHGFALITASTDALGLQLAEAALPTLRPALSVQLQGSLVFAEAVAAFDPTVSGGQPIACLLDPQTAIGPPDWLPATTGDCCESGTTCATLGVGGSIVLEFTSISISGGGSPEPDLWIYERGPDVEDTFVELSDDGFTWVQAGKVFGAVSAVDLDGLGFGPLSLFRYVRLTDDPAEGQLSGCSVGADIDTVAALAPNPWVNLGSSLAGLAGPPKLAASGKLAAGSAIQLAVSGGKPFGAGNLVLGTSTLAAPFKGGTMVPNPMLLVPGLPLGPAGAITLPALWPAGLPAGLSILVQVWIADDGGPKGFAATNALLGLTQ
jgi:hypothetical protein